MAPFNFQPEQDFPVPVAADRFDQKNEMFKRVRWDPQMRLLASRFYKEVNYKKSVGYQKIDYTII